MPHSPTRGPTLADLAHADPPADRRAERFAAGLASLVALGVLLTSSAALCAGQAVVYALAAFVGPRYAPYPAVYRALAAATSGVASRARRPHMASGSRIRKSATARITAWVAGPASPEPPELVRAEHAVGLGLAVLGTLGYLTGLIGLGTVAAGLLLAESLVGAVLGAHPGGALYRALSPLSSRLVRHPSQPDTQQGAIA